MKIYVIGYVSLLCFPFLGERERERGLQIWDTMFLSLLFSVITLGSVSFPKYYSKGGCLVLQGLLASFRAVASKIAA